MMLLNGSNLVIFHRNNHEITNYCASDTAVLKLRIRIKR